MSSEKSVVDDGYYSSASTWDDNVVPTTSTDVTIGMEETVFVAGENAQADTLTIASGVLSDGGYQVNAPGGLFIGDNGIFTGYGSISISTDIEGDPESGAGVLIAAGGALFIEGTADQTSNEVNFLIDANGDLVFDGLVGSAGAAAFVDFLSARGEDLDLTNEGRGADDERAKFEADVEGFTSADDHFILLAGSDQDTLSYDSASDTLNVMDGATVEETIKLVGSGLSDLTRASFRFLAGTTDVIGSVCYAAGTMILTDAGEVAVERLAVGDLAVTASGALRPVVWLGSRAHDLRNHPAPERVWPVRIAEHAFGEGSPHCDLWVSPGHGIACDGSLIPSSALINGVSVAQVKTAAVEYWHVELDAHDVILAEGLPAESYLDTGNRTAFVNGGAFVEAHPDFRPKHWAQTCLPLVLDGPTVAAAKARLLARLVEAGHSVEREAEARIWVDRRPMDPIRLSDTKLAFVLPAGGEDIVLRSRTFVPAHVAAESSDPRALGLCVAALQIDGSPIALANWRECPSGWHEAEYEGESFTHRWTTGATPLPAGARVVIVDLAGDGYYLAEAVDRLRA